MKLDLYPGGFLLFLPWLWIDFSIYASGGINIEFSDPNDIRGMGPRCALMIRMAKAKRM